MNIIGCLDRPTSGTYQLDGEDISSYKDKELAAVRNFPDPDGPIIETYSP